LQYLEFTGGCTFEEAYRLFKKYYYRKERELLRYL
ncbi:toxin, partial [Enterococcus faecium]